MATMPVQKPGKSKQDYGTPPELLKAVRRRLYIENFSLDIAASTDNAVCDFYYTEKEDALCSTRTWRNANDPDGWAWCNPPYADILPWVRKAALEAMQGAHIVMLVPLSISDWWVQWVEPYAYVVELHGRIKFVGAEQGYPKDCALLLYTPFQFRGKEVWTWKRDVPQLQQPGVGED